MSGLTTGILTVMAMLAFLGVVVWAFQSKHKEKFERLARVPLEDADQPEQSDQPNQSGNKP